jgi:hypothetical protein
MTTMTPFIFCLTQQYGSNYTPPARYCRPNERSFAALNAN